MNDEAVLEGSTNLERPGEQQQWGTISCHPIVQHRDKEAENLAQSLKAKDTCERETPTTTM